MHCMQRARPTTNYLIRESITLPHSSTGWFTTIEDNNKDAICVQYIYIYIYVYIFICMYNIYYKGLYIMPVNIDLYGISMHLQCVPV